MTPLKKWVAIDWVKNQQPSYEAKRRKNGGCYLHSDRSSALAFSGDMVHWRSKVTKGKKDLF